MESIIYIWYRVARKYSDGSWEDVTDILDKNGFYEIGSLSEAQKIKKELEEEYLTPFCIFEETRRIVK